MEKVIRYRAKRLKEIMKIKNEYKGYIAENGEKVDLLFTNIDGTPYDPHTISQFWRRIVKRYGLKEISFHDLRHSSASYLLSKGFSMKAIQERFGHKDIKTDNELIYSCNKKDKYRTRKCLPGYKKRDRKHTLKLKWSVVWSVGIN